MSPMALDVAKSETIFDVDDEKRCSKPPPIKIERDRSFDERSQSQSEVSTTLSPHYLSRSGGDSSVYRITDHLEQMNSPSRWSILNSPRLGYLVEPHPMIGEAWEALRHSLVYFRGHPVGTISALEHSSKELNYDQVFIRDFVPSALAFLMNGEPEIVKNFPLKTLRLQSWEKRVDQFKLGEGVMPASFKVLHAPERKTETIIADFDESAIGRVAPVHSGFWWIILLRAYTKSTGDSTLAELPEIQRGMRLF